MIIYRDLRPAEHRGAPPWLMQADGMHLPDTQMRASERGPLWGVGEGYLLGDGPGWRDLPDGWQVRLAGRPEDLDPRRLQRPVTWCETKPVRDLLGRQWCVPILLDATGARAFRVRYGSGYLPVLTAEQSLAHTVALEARAGLQVAYRAQTARPDDPDAGLDLAVAARWLGVLLPIATGISAEALAELEVLDDRMIVHGCALAGGYAPPAVRATALAT